MNLGQYVLRIVCAAVLCGLAQLLFSQSPLQGLVKVVTGLILTVVVLSPCLETDSWQWPLDFENIASQGEAAVSAGESVANSVLSQRIQEQTRTYILNKASEFGAELSVEVQLQEESPYAPCGARLVGTVSPYVKKIITDHLCRELGIPEEEQIWIS